MASEGQGALGREREKAGTGHSGTGLGTPEVAPKERRPKRGRGEGRAGRSEDQYLRGCWLCACAEGWARQNGASSTEHALMEAVGCSTHADGGEAGECCGSALVSARAPLRPM